MTRGLADSTRQRDDIAQKLREVSDTERASPYNPNIMQGSTLTVHVVEARDLKPMDPDGTSDPYAILEIEGNRSETKYVSSTTNPVWNESFQFDIERANEPLHIVVMDKDVFGTDDFEGECRISLDKLRDQMKHDEWFELTHPKKDNWNGGRIRLMLQWIFSKVEYLRSYLQKWDDSIQRKKDDIQDIKEHLSKLHEPFQFLDAMDRLNDESSEEDPDEPEDRKRVRKQIKQKELETVGKFENVALNVAGKFGFDHVPWFPLTKIVLVVYTVLTLFVLFFRTDFINLTVCIVAIYMINNTEDIKKWTFRLLVGMIMLSLIYDLLWFYHNHSDYLNEHKEDGGVEKGIRKFSLYVSWASFFWRFIVMFVFWKDSLDFTRIIRQQGKYM